MSDDNQAERMALAPVPPQGIQAADQAQDEFRAIGGSKQRTFNDLLLLQTLGTVAAVANAEGKVSQDACDAVLTTMEAFKPKDEIEGMLAAQAVALHFGAMECLRRAMIPGQPSELAGKLRKDGAVLARCMTEMLEALDRKRGKGPQVVRVERVVVQDGGQAIVGNVGGAKVGE